MKIFDMEDTFHFKVDWFNWFKNVLDTRSKKKITIIHSFRTKTWKKLVKFLPIYTLIYSIAFSILEYF